MMEQVLKSALSGTWLGSSVGQSRVPMYQGCGFYPWSGHIQESTNECLSKRTTNQCFSLSPPLPHSHSLTLTTYFHSNCKSNNWDNNCRIWKAPSIFILTQEKRNLNQLLDNVFIMKNCFWVI